MSFVALAFALWLLFGFVVVLLLVAQGRREKAGFDVG